MSSVNATNYEVTSVDIVAATLCFLACPFIIFGNSLVIIAIIKYPRLKNPTNWLVFNLSLADMMIGLFLPFLATIYINYDLRSQEYACFVRYFICMLCGSVSIMTLTAITVDRLVSIASPLRHSQLVTDQRVLAASIVCWVYSILICLPPMAGWNTWKGVCVFQKIMPPGYVFFISGNFAIMVIAVIIMYVKIFQIAKKQMSQIAALTINISGDGGEEKKKKQTLGLSKATKMVTLVLGVFLVSWTPFFTIIIVQATLALTESDDYYHPKLDDAELLTGVIGLVNSMWNPLIYSWKNHEYRRAFKKILHCGKQVEHQDPTTSGRD